MVKLFHKKTLKQLKLKRKSFKESSVSSYFILNKKGEKIRNGFNSDGTVAYEICVCHINNIIQREV